MLQNGITNIALFPVCCSDFNTMSLFRRRHWRKIKQILLVCALGLVTMVYEGRCGSWVCDSHMFSIFTFVFIAALQHIKLHLFERGQPASTITENSKHRVLQQWGQKNRWLTLLVQNSNFTVLIALKSKGEVTFFFFFFFLQTYRNKHMQRAPGWFNYITCS